MSPLQYGRSVLAGFLAGLLPKAPRMLFTAPNRADRRKRRRAFGPLPRPVRYYRHTPRRAARPALRAA